MESPSVLYDAILSHVHRPYTKASMTIEEDSTTLGLTYSQAP